MKTRHLVCLAWFVALLMGWQVNAADRIKGPKGLSGQESTAELNGNAPPAPAGKLSVEPPAPQQSKEPWIRAHVVIGAEERRIIQSHVDECVTPARHGRKAKGLPPGLAKKAARGGDLPPGWQKKCVRGEVMPEEVYRQCHPLPPEIVVKLPAPPPGTILVTIDGKVARLARATREILDVFDVRL